jgi:uncharacterized membrane-anchored protein
MTDKLITNISIFLLTFLLTIIFALLAATLGGSLLWILYPHIHALFPSAAENGVIAKELGWWDSVCIFWILAIVFKSELKASSKIED